MAGVTNYPTALDDNTSLFDVTNNVTPLAAAHHNNLKAAMIAVENRLGILGGSSATAIDVRLGHPTLGHTHSGASGQGPAVGGGNFTEVGDTYVMKPSLDSISDITELNRLQLLADEARLISEGAIFLRADNNDALAFNYKHYMVGGWGTVFPPIATAGIHATYSEIGQAYYDDAANKLRVYTGATWRAIAFE